MSDCDNTEGVFEVESILGSRMVGGHELFLVKWVGFSKSHATWEPIDSLVTCDVVLAEFRKRQQKEKNKRKDKDKIGDDIFTRPQMPVDQTFEVDKVIADRTFGGNMEFLVTFTMEGMEPNWIPMTDLNCQESIDDYFKVKQIQSKKRQEFDFDKMVPEIGNHSNKKVERIITLVRDRQRNKFHVQYDDGSFGILDMEEGMRLVPDKVLRCLEQFAFVPDRKKPVH